MKRIGALLAGLAIPLVLSAQRIRDVDITVDLQADGTARITQVWDVNVVRGTEWYIPIGNLDGMTVGDLSVSENGRAFASEGRRWDTERSLEQKAGRCGIVETRDGVELCWGQGSYGDHVWTASFTVTGLVQRLDDADAFNFMFVNPGLAAPPEHAKVTIRNATGGPAWTYDNTGVWGFGFDGEINVRNGEIIAESSEPFGPLSKLIAMVRFDKGLFEPAVSRSMSFDEMRDIAMEGSAYSPEEEDPFEKLFLGIFAFIFLGGLATTIWGIVQQALGKKYKKSLYGKNKITEWYREAPMQGDLFASFYVLENGWRFGGKTSSHGLIGALFLRWILDGKMSVQPDPKKSKRVNLAFAEEAEIADDVERNLYDMAREASGANLLLESGEFEKWSEKNFKKVTAWPLRAQERGRQYLQDHGYFLRGSTTTEEGAREACHVIEFKNFLNDFTLSKERGAVEVGLWKDYLVFAQLYGIADRVAEQFQRLFPAEFQEVAGSIGVDPTAMMRTIRMTDALSASVINRAVARQQAGSYSGKGGHTSFGGGGGFSGGGFGGGSR